MSAALKIRKGESVEQWLQRLPQSQSTVLSELRSLIGKNAPHLEERVKWSSPWYEGNDNVFYLACQREYATFGVCNGAHLNNTLGLLEGIGKNMRHVKVPSFEVVPKDKLAVLIDLAVKYDQGLAKP
ncbi:MAG: DUF1801 domain-containing protein [Rubricoccaceae bacterium]|nr:DUF1801 domain-containing protein [Rubricoccaceae bacterium]